MVKDAFEVEGNHTLKGTLKPQGAKNEALQILCAVLLTEEQVTISNIPTILDVTRLIELLSGLGVKVEKISEGEYSFTSSSLDREFMSSDEFDKKAKAIRGSVMLIGPLLARLGKMYLPKPGGDKIGRRRLDTHFMGLNHLGAEVHYDASKAQYFIEANELKGAYIHMDEVSVTGTANVVMAAVLAQGTTTVYNAAGEPYLQQLCKMLVRMGARIEGIGSNLLTITGVSSLKGTTHTMLPDMIEVGSFIGLAAMTQSEIRILNAGIKDLGIIPDVFRKMGVTILEEGDDLFIPAQDEYEISTFMDGSILTVYDAPWPGFTPDLMSVVLVLAVQAKGSVLIHQKMFESRLFFVDKLIDMGAQIILCDPHRATVIGLNRKHSLRGIEMSSPDIRAGVALLLAALSAKGTSLIHNVHQIDRGYQNIDGRLNAIGAHIRRL